MCGVAYVTGLRGVGKSYLAAQADYPSNVLFLDFEEKGAGIDAQLNFGKYVSVTAEVAREQKGLYKPKHVFPYLKTLISGIEQDRYTVAVLDNIQPFEEALAAEIKDTPAIYGIKPGNAESGAYGGVWPAVNFLVSNFCNLLYSKGIRLIIAIAHVKPAWVGGQPMPGKYRPKGVDRWQELSILSLVVVRGDEPPVPSAIVLKEQLGRITCDPETGEFTMQRRLPLRLPRATFKAIRDYLDSPADLKNPKAGEVPTQEEIGPYQEKFDKEQLGFLQLMKLSKKEDGEESVGDI